MKNVNHVHWLFHVQLLKYIVLNELKFKEFKCLEIVELLIHIKLFLKNTLPILKCTNKFFYKYPMTVVVWKSHTNWLGNYVDYFSVYITIITAHVVLYNKYNVETILCRRRVSENITVDDFIKRKQNT